MWEDRYDKYFRFYCRQFFGSDFDWLWIKALACVESSLRVDAVSPAGALGIMQLMPSTARRMARTHGAELDLFDADTNIFLGVRYARRCFDIWKKEKGLERIRFMLASYNAGPGHIIRAQRQAEVPDKWECVAIMLPGITGDKAQETINHVLRVEKTFKTLKGEK